MQFMARVVSHRVYYSFDWRIDQHDTPQKQFIIKRCESFPQLLLMLNIPGFSTTASTDDLLAGDCTSCEVVQDKSAYWHPALYFQAANGDFKVVEQVGGMLA